MPGSLRDLSFWDADPDLGRVVLSVEQIAARVAELGAAVTADYADRPPLLVGVLKGAFIFLADLARQIAIPVIASGGVASLADLTALHDLATTEARPLGAGIEGVIIGRALYDGRIDPAAALALFSA